MYFCNPKQLPIRRGDRVLLIPILSDVNTHRCQNRISFVYLHNINTGEWCIINNHHCDSFEMGIDWIEHLQDTVYTYNSASLYKLGVDGIDIQLLYWLMHGNHLECEYPSNLQVYHRWNYKMENANDTIPITLHIEWIQGLISKLDGIFDMQIDDTVEFYMNALRNLWEIEDAGIEVVPSRIEEHYGISAKTVHSEYNLFTTTGRPSNTFSGINFAALPKNTRVRSMISPHSDSEILVEFDYTSYHVRLVSNLIGHRLPEGNLHDYFGQQYFGVDALSQEQYEESKGITFALLYGTFGKKFSSVPFFDAVNRFTEKLWRHFKSRGYIRMPLSRRMLKREHFDGITQNKLFNYLIQAHETEVNSLVLRDILRYLYNKKSRLILYTYDSFLIKFHKDDGRKCIEDIQNILKRDGMQVSVSYGKNYDNMKKTKNL